MRIVPLQPLPAQVVYTMLNDQLTRLRVYQKPTGIYIDVSLNDALVIGGVICQNKNRIIRSKYLGYIGDLAFFDTQGDTDPEFSGIGTRYFLGYFDEGEIATAEIT